MALNWNKILGTILFVFFLSINQLEAQKTVSFSKENWEQIVKDKNFDESTIPQAQAYKKMQKPRDYQLPVSILLVFLFMFIFFIFLIWRNRRKTMAEKPLVSIVPIGNSEANFIQTNTEEQLRNYLQAENYKLAFRCQFQMVLQHLDQLNIIHFEPERTHQFLLTEIDSKHPLHHAFKELVNQFDAVWYGDQDIDLLRYNLMLKHFNTCLSYSKHEK